MDIGVVLVTYNRKQKLIKALKSYDDQTYKAKFVIVVNNASTDGTKEYLEEWLVQSGCCQRIVINTEKNIGGSGGFALGLQKAIELMPEWIWVSDDDAYPDRDAFEQCVLTVNKLQDNSIVAVSGAVYVNGKIDVSHRRRIHYGLLKIREKQVPLSEYDLDNFMINEFSYVGTLIKCVALLKAGVTNKDYFIHYDDSEHSLRLGKIGKIVCAPSIRISHDITLLQNSSYVEYNSSWQKYYDYRNLLDMYRRSFPKRYYYFQYFTYKVKSILPILFGLSDEENAILKTALSDVKNGILGISSTYGPGYKRSRNV